MPKDVTQGGCVVALRSWAITVLGLVVALLAGCATFHQPSPAWRCDPAIDALVESGQWETALAGHERLLRANPDNCLARYHLGFIWGHLGERASEVEAYEQAIVCGYDRDDRLYFNLGMAYADLRQWQRAVTAMKRAIALNDGNPDNFFGLAVIAEAVGRSAEAEEALQRAIAVAPGHLEARLALARRYLDQSRWADARLHLDAAETIDPDHEEARYLKRVLEERQAAEYDRDH